MFVSVCLFFNSSRSLLIDSCIFSILFFFKVFLSSLLSLFWILFQVVFLFPLHLFGLLCFYFVPSFVQYFSAVLFFLLLLSYCVWGLLFLDFKESWILSLRKSELFLPLGFCLPKVGPVVCMSLVFHEICAEFLLFVFPLMVKAEWGGNPVCWWLGLYFCFVFVVV